MGAVSYLDTLLEFNYICSNGDGELKIRIFLFLSFFLEKAKGQVVHFISRFNFNKGNKCFSTHYYFWNKAHIQKELQVST
jgi:hypothetical protein